METFLEIIKITLPSVIVFLTAWLMFRSMIENENRRKLLELKTGNQQLLTPVRLQAYERVVLYLERISPQSIVMRLHQPGMSAEAFQQSLVSNIREEFEHNLSQQIYLSSPAWELVRNAREEMVKLVNIAASRVAPGGDATELSTRIFELSMGSNKLPVSSAIDYIKKEIRQVF